MKFNLRDLIFLIFSMATVANYVQAAEATDKIRNVVKGQFPDVEIMAINKSPIEGLYEVVLGAQIVYVDEEARYVIDGDMYDIVTRKNYSEDTRASIRLEKIEQFGEENMIIYKPDSIKHTVTVVTDINCPYCRRLHAEIGDYLKNGIKVRYIFMPLKGQEDFEKTVSVWCSKDKNHALDVAKAGGDVEKANCDNPIRKHLMLARELGVRGTPAIILQNGTMMPGYVPIAKLVQLLNASESEARR